MIQTKQVLRGIAASMLVLGCTMVSGSARVAWQQDANSLGWRVGDDLVWRFSFDPAAGKPFFHPLGPVGGPSLTNFKPEDHPWHYGLWFSWKYINGANYWEENRASGKAEGATRWTAPAIEARADGSATVRMSLTYTHPSGRVDLTETRLLAISPPDGNGGYTIDWRSSFIAGSEGALLDRTAMPGEPGGQVNGGYAGLGARLASAPLVMSVVTPEGPVTNFVSDRARPASGAVACNFADDGKDVGAIAILSDPSNIGALAPWYLINSPAMRFADPAILAPAIRTLRAGEVWNLRYQIAIRRTAWTPETLQAAMAAWLAPSAARGTP